MDSSIPEKWPALNCTPKTKMKERMTKVNMAKDDQGRDAIKKGDQRSDAVKKDDWG